MEAEGVECGDAGDPPPFYPTACKGHRALPVPVTRPTLAEVGPDQSLGFSLSVGRFSPVGASLLVVWGVRAFIGVFYFWWVGGFHGGATWVDHFLRREMSGKAIICNVVLLGGEGKGARLGKRWRWLLLDW